MFKNSNVLITGGTGSFGQKLTEKLLNVEESPKKIIIFSRDEFKQNEMSKRFGGFPNKKLRFIIGDVRDISSLNRIMKEADYVFHAAALKQIPLCEYNPYEAVKTNINGTQNVITTAIDNHIEKVMFIGTDKAVNPINLYGATKLVAEKLIIQANILGKNKTKFSAVRYGNVLASRGSVFELFKYQAEFIDCVAITDKRMTRFWWTLDQAIDFVLNNFNEMYGGEIFIPDIKSSLVIDLAKIAFDKVNNKTKKFSMQEIGIRPGEKLHEVLVTKEEVDRLYKNNYGYFIKPVESLFAFESDKEFLREDTLNENYFNSKNRIMEYRELKKLVESIDE